MKFLLFYCNFTVTFAFVYGLKNEGRVRASAWWLRRTRRRVAVASMAKCTHSLFVATYYVTAAAVPAAAAAVAAAVRQLAVKLKGGKLDSYAAAGTVNPRKRPALE